MAVQGLPLIGTHSFKGGGILRWYNPAETGYVGLKAGVVTSSIDYTLPLAPPTEDGQVLSSDTDGVMSWGDGGAGDGTPYSFHDSGPQIVTATGTTDDEYEFTLEDVSEGWSEVVVVGYYYSGGSEHAMSWRYRFLAKRVGTTLTISQFEDPEDIWSGMSTSNLSVVLSAIGSNTSDLLMTITNLASYNINFRIVGRTVRVA